jgi:hypothetical protein
MAQRSNAHEPQEQQSGLVPVGASTRQYPLLPYEKQICELAGLSEEEYKWFKEEVAKGNYIRPAEYDLVPDVRCEVSLTAVLINLAIGLAFTGISYLLTPKPPGAPEEVKQRQLGSVKGRDRYAPIYGFDSLAEIATYGDAVPLVWTRYTGTTGGVVIAPKLIWSRVYSWGGFQTAKFLYTAGVFGVDRPELEGVWLGNNALNIVDDTQFAFYWRTQSSGDLVKHYGSDVGRNSGDPSGHRFPSFSQAYTPSNSTIFGVSNPVPNGTNYRVNWRVISRIGQERDSEGWDITGQERRKICGYFGRGMPGVGTGFPRRQGLIAPNTFRITGVWLSGSTFSKNVSEDDINSELDAECIAADETFQVGEQILIGGRLFSVTARSTNDVFVPKIYKDDPASTIDITLTTKEDVDPGFAPRTVNASSIGHNGIISRDTSPYGSQGAVYGIGNDPALRFTAASIRTTRACDVVEVGIKSNVWGRFNGICNFKTLPFPAELIAMDADNVSVTNGTMSQHFMRTAVFTIRYRVPDSNGIYPNTWTSSNVLFAIRGAVPQDQYNFIRLENGATRNIEYQFTPLSGSSITRRNDDHPIYWVYSKTYDPDGGNSSVLSVSLGNSITAVFAGKQLRADQCQYEPRMWQENNGEDATKYRPDDGEWQGYRSNALYKLKEAWMWEVFSESRNVPNNTLVGKVLDFVSYRDSSLVLTVLFRARYVNGEWTHVSQEVYNPDSSDASRSGATDSQGNAYPEWQMPQNNTSSSAKWVDNGAIYYNCIYPVQISDENPFNSRNFGDTIRGDYTVTARMGVDNTPSVVPSADYRDRYFETNTQCMEVSHYGNLIARSCDNNPEHQIVYVNEVRRNLSPSRAGLTLAGVSIKSSRNFTAAEQLNCWIGNGTQNSNSFPELVAYLLEKAAQNSNLNSSMVDQASLTSAASYCNSNGLFFDGVISDRQNLRSFIESTAPYFLLNMVVKNGKIGLQPAIPTGSPVAMFTAGNIIAGSLKVDYIPESSRRPFQAAVSYRRNPKNQLPRTMTVLATWAGGSSDPMEQIDLSGFCTSHDHAVKVARYFMAIRKYVTKTISFQTLPDQAPIGPGDFIQVAIEQTTASSGYVGTITGGGQVVTPVKLPDGAYDAVYYKEGQDSVQEAAITVVNGQVTTPEAWGSLFAIRSTTINTQQYVIDQIELDQEGLVNVQASEFPPEISSTTFNGDGITITPSTPDAY